MDKLIPAGRILFAISMIGLGVEHFVLHEFVTGRAPPWPQGLPARHRYPRAKAFARSRQGGHISDAEYEKQRAAIISSV